MGKLQDLLVPEIGVWLKIAEANLSLGVSREEARKEIEILRRAKIGFFYNGPFPEFKRATAIDIAGFMDVPEKEANRTFDELKYHLNHGYSLGVVYPKEISFRTSCLHIHFNGGEEAIEDAMKRTIKLFDSLYPNIYYVSRLELEAMKALKTPV